MDLTRREFLSTAVLPTVALALAAAAPVAASLPAIALAEPPAPPDPYRLDELPLSGLAGECSGWQ